jgi:hypothetical protein
MMPNSIVSHQEWPKARLERLAAEKDFIRQRDVPIRRRMAMPWQRVADWLGLAAAPTFAIMGLLTLVSGRAIRCVRQGATRCRWAEWSRCTC